MTESQRSSAMLASFLSRVMPALCTTTSTPPCFSVRWWAIRCGASLPVMSRVSQSPSSSFISDCSSLAACGTSTPRTVAPSRCSTRAICSPMPRLAPVTRATLPASGRVQSPTSGAFLVPWAPIRTTCPETYADLGESRKASVLVADALGALGDVHELDRAAVADLLAEAAGEALKCALGHALGALDLLGRGADDDHVRAAVEAAEDGGEELAKRLQVGGRREAGGVEDQALEGGALLGDVRGRDARAGRAGRAATRRAGRCRR